MKRDFLDGILDKPKRSPKKEMNVHKLILLRWAMSIPRNAP
jgi:hypothetical protein